MIGVVSPLQKKIVALLEGKGRMGGLYLNEVVSKVNGASREQVAASLTLLTSRGVLVEEHDRYMLNGDHKVAAGDHKVAEPEPDPTEDVPPLVVPPLKKPVPAPPAPEPEPPKAAMSNVPKTPPTDEHAAFMKRLGEKRAAAGLSQGKLAALLKMEQTNLSRIERGIQRTGVYVERARAWVETGAVPGPEVESKFRTRQERRIPKKPRAAVAAKATKPAPKPAAKPPAAKPPAAKPPSRLALVELDVYGSLLAHVSAWRKGELHDPQTGYPHLEHAESCLAFLRDRR